VSTETSTENLRLRALTWLLNELKARLAALEARVAALEQSQSKRWFR
jgi:hypothetical protein